MKQTRLGIAKDKFLQSLNELHYDPAHDNLNPDELKEKESNIIKQMVNELTLNEDETVAFFSKESNFRYCYRLLPLVQEKLHSSKLEKVYKEVFETMKKGEGKFKVIDEELEDDINNFIN